MMYLKRHLLRGKIIEGIIFPLFFLVSCSDKYEPEEYVARVNDSYLTEEELSQIVDTAKTSASSKYEAVNDWIRKELFYQEAVSEGIVDEEQFEEIIKNSRKELAGALLLQKYSSEEALAYSPPDLEKYYNKNRSNFTLSSKAYYVNRASFNNYDSAVQFRTEVISKSWDQAVSGFKQDTSVADFMSGILLNENEIYPPRVSRIIKQLYPLEISIVISDDAGYYTVVQVLEMFNRGSVPPFDIIKSEVEKRYVAEVKKAALEKYIDELYSKNEIEINY